MMGRAGKHWLANFLTNFFQIGGTYTLHKPADLLQSQRSYCPLPRSRLHHQFLLSQLN